MGLRQLARPQLVLDQPGLDLQVLRDHPCRPPAQGYPQGRPHQLDRRPRPQAPLQQHLCRSQKDLEETEHPLSLALPINVSPLSALTWLLKGIWARVFVSCRNDIGTRASTKFLGLGGIIMN